MDCKESESKCMICGDLNSNWHFGAIICEACKKFFIRSQKSKYHCSKLSDCVITLSTRASCQYCRLKKCIDIGMDINIKSAVLDTSKLVKTCMICGDKSTGLHFGVFSCEACKGFFRRSAEKDMSNKYVCIGKKENCLITTKGRSCRYCRYQKCLKAGMLKDAIRVGRQSNIFKHLLIETNREDSNQSSIMKIIQNRCSSSKRKCDAIEANAKKLKLEYDDSMSSSYSKDISLNSPESSSNQNINNYLQHYSANYEPTILNHNTCYSNYYNYNWAYSNTSKNFGAYPASYPTSHQLSPSSTSISYFSNDQHNLNDYSNILNNNQYFQFKF